MAGYSARIEKLKTLKAQNQSEAVILEPLPFTQHYHSAEIGREHGWVNVCLERGMRLPFQVVSD